MAGHAGAVRVVALVFLVLGLAVPAAAANLYRYINEKGYQEIGYSVPNHLVPNGYDVIDESGRLVRRVAAQLSEEEYAAQLERERRLDACRKAVEQVHRRYESLEDIDEAELLFEQQLTESMKNARANLDYSRSELAKQEAHAASLERAGEAIPRNVLKSVADMEEKIRNLTAQLENGEKSRLTKAAEFNEERRVFQLSECDAEQLAAAR